MRNLLHKTSFLILVLIGGASLACRLLSSSGSSPSETINTPKLDPTSAYVPFTSNGRVFYVAAQGNNSNPGSQAAPWATPGYASRQLQSGDTLIILGGRYTLSLFDDDIITPPSGTENAWITIRGEEGNRPILAGRDNLLTAVNLSGIQYVRLENLEITHDDQANGESGWFRDGLEILGVQSSHIILNNLYIHHVDEFGMNIQDVEDLQILNTRIEYAGFGGLGGPAGEKGGWRNAVIRKSSLSWSGHYYQGGDGSNRPYDRPDGFGIEPSQGPITIEDTTVEHNYGDGVDSKAANTTIRRTIVANNSCDGVKLWGNNSRIENVLIYGRGDGNPETTPWSAIVIAPEQQINTHFELINITVDDFLGKNYLMYVQYDYPEIATQVVLRNAILSGRGDESPIFIAPASTLSVDHNLFFFTQNETLLIHGEQLFTCQEVATLGEGNLCGDPLFIHPAWGETGDYHLQAGSLAIDGGSNQTAPGEDLANTLRIPPLDIGAYEFH